MENLKNYEKFRKVPPEAQKAISGGRLSGKTDINPMWRIKVLTEVYGSCGVGWKYEVVKFWLEHGANEEVSAFAQINLYTKEADKWSEAIPGIGGSSFVAKEKSGLYTSDECYKMALTDAISVSCKALGVGADIYWKDGTKYTTPVDIKAPTEQQLAECKSLDIELKNVATYMKCSVEDLSTEDIAAAIKAKQDFIAKQKAKESK